MFSVVASYSPLSVMTRIGKVSGKRTAQRTSAVRGLSGRGLIVIRAVIGDESQTFIVCKIQGFGSFRPVTEVYIASLHPRRNPALAGSHAVNFRHQDSLGGQNAAEAPTHS
jgi:hypothetical protein